MNFAWALKELRKNKYVRRNTWGEIKTNTGKICGYIVLNAVDEFCNQDGNNYTFRDEDLIADDWVEYNPDPGYQDEAWALRQMLASIKGDLEDHTHPDMVKNLKDLAEDNFVTVARITKDLNKLIDDVEDLKKKFAVHCHDIAVQETGYYKTTRLKS